MLGKMNDYNEDVYESKFYSEIKYISHVEIKEEIIIPDNTSDGESTLSDNEENPRRKHEECVICSKYRSMFIILKNHDCQTEGDNKCKFCTEISHWAECFKTHQESHQLENESDNSSDSTTSDREENEEKCMICLKYEFMIPLLNSHICRSEVDSKCSDCSEVLQWMSCYKNHSESHESKNFQLRVNEENLSDSTASDNEEIQKLLSPLGKQAWEKCQICLKYQGMFIILEENHLCDIEKPNKNCEKCNEINNWYNCFGKHKKTHQTEEKTPVEKTSKRNFAHFNGKFGCGVCLKLNSIVTNLVKHHKCNDSKRCPVCQEMSYWLTCLKNHKQSETISDTSDGEDTEILKNLPEKIDCPVCLKYSATIVNLSDHVCRKKGRHKCGSCREVSFWVKNFKLHENLHSKPVSPLRNFFSCSSCGKRFNGEKMLNVHKSYCKSCNFSCDLCDRKFVNIFSLKKHKIFHLCRSPSINLQYKCKVCKETFSNSSDCKNHENFHDFTSFKCTKTLNELKPEIC